MSNSRLWLLGQPVAEMGEADEHPECGSHDLLTLAGFVVVEISTGDYTRSRPDGPTGYRQYRDVAAFGVLEWRAAMRAVSTIRDYTSDGHNVWWSYADHVYGCGHRRRWRREDPPARAQEAHRIPVASVQLGDRLCLHGDAVADPLGERPELGNVTVVATIDDGAQIVLVLDELVAVALWRNGTVELIGHADA